MAAALQQYQACLGIMLRLQVEDLTALKADFDRVGRGLSLEEFIGVMLDRVHWEPDNVVAFIEDLMELFAQVDVNGDGTMEWEEFTSAIIEGGMGTAGDDADWRDLQYEESPHFGDVLNRPPRRVQYLPEFRRLLVHDNARPVVEIVDPGTLYEDDTGATAAGVSAGTATGAGAAAAGGGSSTGPAVDAASGGGGGLFTPTLTIANKFHPLCYITGYRRDQDDVRSERSPVQALKYLSRVDLLAVSGGDLKLTFWASTIVTATSASALETPTPMAIVHTPRPQRVLEWNPETLHLYSISADLVITVWHVVRERLHDAKGHCEVSLVTTLKHHTDLLQDLLLLNPETLVSCGMDSAICLWDAQSLHVRATRQGHRRGVRLLTRLSAQLFLSTGFECEILGWDVSALATAPVFRLWGHNAPVCCIQLIQSSSSGAGTLGLVADQALSVDEEGWFKWWNLANITSMEANDLEPSASRCLQTFRLGSDKYPWRAHSLAVLNGGQTIVAAGLHKLKLLQRVRLKPRVLASTAVLYNGVSFTLLTTTDRELRIWDAASGTLIRTYRGIAPSDISCVDLDARQRKLVFGTQRGELVVLNYLNGAILKTWTPHQLNVSALIYCKEDQCVLTASWDRSLRLYDDNANTNALLRCITEAHEADIRCMAYCYPMALVATGSADGVIKLWDYIYFLLEDTCALQPLGLPMSDVAALEFVDPYPLLLSGHENGMLCCWNVSPAQPATLLFHYSPFLWDPTTTSTSGPNADGESKGAICGCRVFYDASGGELLAGDIRKGRFLVVTASIDGELAIDDISRPIALSRVKACRQESLPLNHHQSYNPRRRFIRHGKTAKRLKNHLKDRQQLPHDHHGSGSGEGPIGAIEQQPPEAPDGRGDPPPLQPPRVTAAVGASDVERVKLWRAHNGSVRYVQVVEEPPTILSCSSDRTVKVWSFEGECLGSLMGAQQTRAVDSSAPAWTWEIDSESPALYKREQATALWEKIQPDKLKLLAHRHQTRKAAAKQRRRNSMGLGTSASAPGLGAMGNNQLEPGEQPPPLTTTDTERLFQQLKGEATWKQSDFQLARQVAWEKEREKFQQRMKRILKKRTGAKTSTAAATIDEGEPRDEVDPMHETLAEVVAVADPASTLLPGSLNASTQELPYEDKDNWAVGSMNREKQMYSHFHHENTRRSQKVLASKASKLRRIESTSSIDLAPSAFLLEKLGKSCVIQEGGGGGAALAPVKRTQKKKTLTPGLRGSRSTSALAKSSSSSLLTAAAGDMAATEPTPVATAAPPRPLVPQPSIKELFQQYDKALQEQEVEEQKIHRASLLLSNARTARNLQTLEESDEEHVTVKKKPLSPSRRQNSMAANVANGSSNSGGGVARGPRRKSSVNADTSEKKQRIRSDTQLMRQDHFGLYKRDDVVNIYRTFKKIDKDESGTITLRELLDGAGLFGSTHLKDNVMSIFSSIDKDQSGHIDLHELCSAVFNEASDETMAEIMRFYTVLEGAERAKKTRKKQLSAEQLSELKLLFKLYDADHNGDIDVDELFNALRYNEKFYDDDDGGGGGGSRGGGAHITKDDVRRIIARFDMNTNSTLDLNEFIELFREEL